MSQTASETTSGTVREQNLRVAVRNLARALGDDISEEQPLLDARLPDGSRVAAALPPVSLGRRRDNILISGGTGTGKTALLNALTAFLPPDDRLVQIQELAGHQNIMTTERYMHLNPTAIENAIRLLDHARPVQEFGDIVETV